MAVSDWKTDMPAPFADDGQLVQVDYNGTYVQGKLYSAFDQTEDDPSYTVWTVKPHDGGSYDLSRCRRWRFMPC